MGLEFDVDVEVFFVILEEFLEGCSKYFWFNVVYEALMIHEGYAVLIKFLAQRSCQPHVESLFSTSILLGRVHHPMRKKEVLALLNFVLHAQSDTALVTHRHKLAQRKLRR